MKVKALAIAGALSVVSIALPLSAKAHESAEQRWFLFTSGAFAAVCDLHIRNAISTEDVIKFQEGYAKNIDDQFLGAMSQAIAQLLEKENFKACPLRRY